MDDMTHTVHKDSPPCQLACPILTDVREYVQLIAERRYEEALASIRKLNPLPRVCGRICTHPCEGACKRGQADEPIAIAALKRFAADGPWRGRYKAIMPDKSTGHKVAVVGSGPAGLAGIPPVRAEEGLRIIRPLWACSRQEIEVWLRDRGESWREDRTNLDIQYQRNRIRHELIPELPYNIEEFVGLAVVVVVHSSLRRTTGHILLKLVKCTLGHRVVDVVVNTGRVLPGQAVEVTWINRIVNGQLVKPNLVFDKP